MKSVKLFKMIDGSDIIAEKIGSDMESYIRVRNPFRIVVIPKRNVTGSDATDIGFIEFSPFSDTVTFDLNINLVLCQTDPKAAFYDQYVAMTSPIIQPVSQSKILTA